MVEEWTQNTSNLPNSIRPTRPVSEELNPDKADEWVKAMEKVFSILYCTDSQKVAFVTYILEADAEFQWSGVQQLLEESQTEITWDVFRDAFYKKYFPASVRNAKELEFMQLH